MQNKNEFDNSSILEDREVKEPSIGGSDSYFAGL